MNEKLRLLTPCPWCAAGSTDIRPNGRLWSGTKWSEPISVSVQHWCEPEPGQPARMIERVGRDEESAIAAWNRCARPEPAAPSVAPEPPPGCTNWTPLQQQERDDAARALNATPLPGSPEALKMAEALAGLGTMSPRLRKLYDDAAAVLRTAPPPAAPSVAPEPAPVAYKVWHREAKHCFCLASELPTEFRSDTGEPDEYFGGKVQPLFAHPPRAPLTPEQVWASTDIMACNSKAGLQMHVLMDLVRAVEAAQRELTGTTRT